MPNLVKQVKNQFLKNLYMMPFLKNYADISYHHALQNHVKYLPEIPASDRAIIEQLRTDGVVITSLDALGISSSSTIWNLAHNLIPELAQVVPESWHEYVVHATDEQIVNNSSIFMWGLETRLLNLAENYLGLPIAYHGTYFRRDLANLIERKSRCWHIDREDRRMFKMIIYLHDVDDDGGAFQYLPLDLSTQLTQEMNYRYGYIRDRQMQTHVSPEDYRSCIGVAGTVVIADTGRVFHRGKIPIHRDRFSLFYDYTSRQPQYPFYCKSSLSSSDLLKLAMKMTDSQKQCVFWREATAN